MGEGAVRDSRRFPCRDLVLLILRGTRQHRRSPIAHSISTPFVDPYWPLRTTRELGHSISWPRKYLRGAPRDSPERIAAHEFDEHDASGAKQWPQRRGIDRNGRRAAMDPLRSQVKRYPDH